MLQYKQSDSVLQTYHVCLYVIDNIIYLIEYWNIMLRSVY